MHRSKEKPGFEGTTGGFSGVEAQGGGGAARATH